jgi:hypothetical protein
MIKKIIILVLIFTLIIINVFGATIYFDVQDHWAREDIYWATNEQNIFNGYGDYTFKPERNISRAEFLTILYRAGRSQGIFFDEFSGNLKYQDFDLDHWSYSYVLSLKNNISLMNEKNIDDIFSRNIFEPNKPITREEAARVTSLITSVPIEEIELNFQDLSRNYAYREEIQKLYSNNIIMGYNDNTFRPSDNITRAESSSLIKNIFEDIYYHKNIFVNSVNYLYEYKRFFPLFMDYNYSETTEEDERYIKAVSTLEYLNFGGYIYPGDEHLYDTTPVKTLTNLHNNDYKNKIGTKYYILKYGKLESESKTKFIESLLQLIYKNEEISHRSKVLILKDLFSYTKDPVLYSIVVDSLIETTDNYNEKFDLFFLKIDYLLKIDRLEVLEESKLNNLEEIVNYLLEEEHNLAEEEIQNINNLKKDEKFNIILYYKLNKSLIDYWKGNFRNGFDELYKTYNFLKDNEDYRNLLDGKEKNIIGVLKELKSMY